MTGNQQRAHDIAITWLTVQNTATMTPDVFIKKYSEMYDKAISNLDGLLNPPIATPVDKAKLF